MSRHYSYVALGILALIFVLQLGEALNHPFDVLIPELLGKLSVAILSGVAIGAILAGLKNNHDG